MIKVGLLRLIAQCSSLLMILALKEISVVTVGIYALSVSVISITSALLTYEGTFLVISRNIRPSQFLQNLKANRIIWLIFLVSVTIYYSDNYIIILCVLGFVINTDSDYYVNISTMGRRAFGNNVKYQKFLRRKILYAEICIPLISAAVVYQQSTKLSIFTILIYGLILITFNYYFIWLSFYKKYQASFRMFIPDMNGFAMATLKRTDSQLYRIIIGFSFGADTLGQIYPALVIGRLGSIIGNIWYVWNFKSTNSIKRMSEKIWKNNITILVVLFLVAILYMYSAQPVVIKLFDWDVKLIIYGCFFMINIQFLYKTFLRSIAVSSKKVARYNYFMLFSIIIRAIVVFAVSYEVELWLQVCIICDIILFYFLHKKTITDNLMSDKTYA